MSSIRSNYFEKDFRVDMYERFDEIEGALKIIKHSSLEDIIVNQIDDTIYDYDIIKANVDHAVVKCVISNKNGRRAVGIGESLPSTLMTEISTKYPVLIASQRAFDRAAISFLNIPGKVYSDLELSDNNKAPESESEKPPKQSTEKPQGKIKSEKEEPTSKPPKSAEIKSQTEEGSVKNDLELKDPGKEKIIRGRCRGKLIEEVFKTDIGSIVWIKEKLANNPNTEIQEMIKNIDTYMMLNPDAKAAYESEIAK